MNPTFDRLIDSATELWTTYTSSDSSDSLVSSTTVNTTILASIVFAAFVVSQYSGANARNDGNVKVPYRRGIPLVGSWAFFTRRVRFVDEGFKKLGGMFRFNILNVSPGHGNSIAGIQTSF